MPEIEAMMFRIAIHEGEEVKVVWAFDIFWRREQVREAKQAV